jgi:protein kinase
LFRYIVWHPFSPATPILRPSRQIFSCPLLQQLLHLSLRYTRMQRYKIEDTIGDGSFGTVFRAIDSRTGDPVAVKALKTPYASWAECLGTREVASLTKLKHENIIRLRELVYVKEDGHLYFVFEYAHANLYSLITQRKTLASTGMAPAHAAASESTCASGFTECEVRAINGQLLRSLMHMHKFGFFHRDIKPENILIIVQQPAANKTQSTYTTSSTSGTTPREDPTSASALASHPIVFPPSIESTEPSILFKLCDFGQARETRSRPPYTGYVSTRWYRAPEVICGMNTYNSPIDIWAAGCVMAEVILGRPLFPGTSALNQLFTIANILGPPTLTTWPDGYRIASSLGLRSTSDAPLLSMAGVPSTLENLLVTAGASEEAISAISSMLQWDPSQRPSASDVLSSPFFRAFTAAVEDRDRKNSGAAPKRGSIASLAPGTADLVVGMRASESPEGWTEEQYVGREKDRESPATWGRADGAAAHVSAMEASKPLQTAATLDLDEELRSLDMLGDLSPAKATTAAAKQDSHTSNTSRGTNRNPAGLDSELASLGLAPTHGGAVKPTLDFCVPHITTTTPAATVSRGSSVATHRIPSPAPAPAAAPVTVVRPILESPSRTAPSSPPISAPIALTTATPHMGTTTTSASKQANGGFFTSLFSGFRRNPKTGSPETSPTGTPGRTPAGGRREASTTVATTTSSTYGTPSSSKVNEPVVTGGARAQVVYPSFITASSPMMASESLGSRIGMDTNVKTGSELRSVTIGDISGRPPITTAHRTNVALATHSKGSHTIAPSATSAAGPTVDDLLAELGDI